MNDLARALLGGGVAAGARAIRWLDDGDPRGREVLREIFPHTGRAHLIGITGPPGAGKSTLVAALIAEARTRGRRVGVIAVDPSSPFTGGAILGDRVRMQDTMRDVTYDADLVRKKWGVPPAQIPDLLALMGDDVDNIPGVPGIGQKGAAALLEKYGSLDGVHCALEGRVAGRRIVVRLDGLAFHGPGFPCSVAQFLTRVA